MTFNHLKIISKERQYVLSPLQTPTSIGGYGVLAKTSR